MHPPNNYHFKKTQTWIGTTEIVAAAVYSESYLIPLTAERQQTLVYAVVIRKKFEADIRFTVKRISRRVHFLTRCLDD